MLREDPGLSRHHGPARELLPGAEGTADGNVCADENGWLLWCFFAMNREDRTYNNLMPPPKRLCQADDGALYLRTFEGFGEWIEEAVEVEEPTLLLKETGGHRVGRIDGGWHLESIFGFQAFLLNGPLADFRLDCHLAVDGRGKCGFVFRLDEESHDGYYLSLDLLKGMAPLRAWGTARDTDSEHMMSFRGTGIAGKFPGESLRRPLTSSTARRRRTQPLLLKFAFSTPTL